MSEQDESRPAADAGPPRPIGEIETMIERTPQAPDGPLIREMPDVEPIGEVEAMIERSSKPD